jgi:ABC-type Fe3+/spermidine/putrescine transport system ATPase subunit
VTDLQTPSTPGAADRFIEVENLVVRYGAKTVVKDVSFSIPYGQQLSLLGPSGCGKTTTLRCIAGLETPASGAIRIDGRTMFSSEEGINLPPEKRELSLMFQSYAIWPHMTVEENVGYALRLRKQPKSTITSRVREVLEMVDMTAHAADPATSLSGGQQQRVALARSYAHPPKALLLDEPLSNLDARLRDQMRDDLKEFQGASGVTTVYVTHDQEEAMALSDRVIVMREGVIVQDDQPNVIYRRPRNRFVANFIGAANILAGSVIANSPDVALEVGAATVITGQTGAKPELGREQSVAVRTVHPVLHWGQPPADLENCWPAAVQRVTFLGDFFDLRLEWPGGEMRVRVLAEREIEQGDRLWMSIPPDKVVLLEDD